MPIIKTKKKNAIITIQDIKMYASIAAQKTKIFVVRDFGLILLWLTISQLVNSEIRVNPIVADATEVIKLKTESIRNATGIERTIAIMIIRITLFAI